MIHCISHIYLLILASLTRFPPTSIMRFSIFQTLASPENSQEGLWGQDILCWEKYKNCTMYCSLVRSSNHDSNNIDGAFDKHLFHMSVRANFERSTTRDCTIYSTISVVINHTVVIVILLLTVHTYVV